MSRKGLRSLPPAEPVVQITSFASLLAELSRIAKEADEKRLTVLIDGFEAEYPELYAFLASLVDAKPKIVISQLTAKWPMLNMLRLHPDAENMVAMIQTEIKRRQNENA